jgi:hypothetical protein
MADELMKYAKGELRPARVDRPLANEARTIYDNARLAVLRADSALAVAAHIMQGVTHLDDRRREIARDDPTLNMLLAEIEATAVQQVKGIQRGLLTNWDF